MNSFKVGGLKIPCSGGAYFRLYPYYLTKGIFRSINSNGLPVIFYTHPWEYNQIYRIKGLKLIDRLRHHHNPKSMLMKFERLLNDFEFTSAANYLRNYHKHEN
jgi:hypothetical protein